MWEFPKIICTILGVPIIRIIIYWAYVGPPYFGKLPCLRVDIQGLDPSDSCSDARRKSGCPHLTMPKLRFQDYPSRGVSMHETPKQPSPDH